MEGINITFDYEKMLEEFRENYYNHGWRYLKDLKNTWEILKRLEEVPALNELAESLDLNIKVLRRKLRKIFPNELYGNLMKDLKDRKTKMSETEFKDLVNNENWQKSPYDDEMVLPKDISIIIEKDGTQCIIKRHPTATNVKWPSGRGPHIIDKSKMKKSSKDFWDEYVSDPETEWNYISHDRKFDKRTAVGKLLSEKRDELAEAVTKKSKATSERFTKISPADFDRLSKEFKRREKEIEQEQAERAAAEDEFHEEE